MSTRARGTANDKAWSRLLTDDPAILQAISTVGYCDIDSSQINEYRESRLACKIDFRQQIPRPFREYSLSVMAVRNGKYRIAQTDLFLDIPDLRSSVSAAPKHFELPQHIKALSPETISSESKALDAASLSGMLDYVFDDRVALVLRGREMSRQFQFKLNDVKLGNDVNYDVEGVQIEVDGGYEGRKGLYLVEAKNKVNDNINLRQLLYPQLHYQQRFGGSKPIRSYLLLYDAPKQTYHFTPFSAFDRDGSNSAFVLDSAQCVTCVLPSRDEPERDYWRELLGVIIDDAMTDLSRPFPQADDFSKIFALFSQLSSATATTKAELFANYAITPRQHDYYGNALRWLKVAAYDTTTQTFSLTANAKQLSESSSSKEQLFQLARIALSNAVFHEYLHQGSANVSEGAIKKNGLNREKSTFPRRMKTVLSWLEYFESSLRLNSL